MLVPAGPPESPVPETSSPGGKSGGGSSARPPESPVPETPTPGGQSVAPITEHAGAAAKGYAGIKMTPNGLGPDFAGTKYLKTDLAPGQKNIVKIKLTGYRYDDFKEANRLAGFKGAKPPKDYTWHHLADYDPATGEATMQLVETGAHEATYTHKGSAWQWEQAHPGQKYDAPKPK